MDDGGMSSGARQVDDETLDIGMPRRRGPRWIVTIVLIAAVSALGIFGLTRHHSVRRTGSTSSSSSSSSSQGAVANPGQTPTHCTQRQASVLVAGFIQAFNAGDLPRLRGLVASEGGGFLSYGIGSPVARPALQEYFALRHSHRETFTLKTFSFIGASGAVGNFQATVIRRADDVSTAKYLVYGADVCGPGGATLAKWSAVPD
jgi:hypothetical protein